MDFARRLLLHEARSTPDHVDAMERVCLALHGRFAPLVSSAGFDALIRRAIKLAARDFAFLAAVNPPTGAPCSGDGFRQAVQGRQSTETTAAVTAILANFIWLLVIFLGETLGLRKVREVWPNVPLEAPGSSSDKARP